MNWFCLRLLSVGGWWGLIVVIVLPTLTITESRALADEVQSYRECPHCPELVVIPAGDFVMGSPVSESGRFDTEGPQHRVSIKAFALAKYSVTVLEFLTFLRETGYQPEPCNLILGLAWQSPGNGLAFAPGPSDSPQQPAVCLSWSDANAYIGWLNEQIAPTNPKEGPYRLPTEAEWEYAARANTTTARWWGDALGRNNANCNGCGSLWDDHLFAPVGKFGPNPFGLFDMLGNAWQWTQDCWHESYVGAPLDGRPWQDEYCRKRVLRGGSWSNLPSFIRSAARIGMESSGQIYDTANDTSFRIARTIR